MFKKIVKRVTSAILAVALSATTITSGFVSAAPNPNPISSTPTNISFSWTEGHISATSVRNVYGVRAAGASLTQYTKLTHTQDFWIIKPNNQTYSNLCINPNASINSGTQPYYAYQVTSGSMDANSNYWQSLTPNVRKTIGLIMHYGYPNGNKGGFAYSSGQDSHGSACFEATQMLVWEAVSGMRVLPSDYEDRDRASGFYHSYESTQWHYTNGTRDYQYSPLIDFFTKSDATMVQNTINYYKYIVNKIAHHIDIPEKTYDNDSDAKSNPTTLKFNKNTKRYEATITTNEALFEDIGARTAIGKLGINIAKQGNTAANGNATYLLWVNADAKFSGTKVTAEMIKSSTKQHANETGRDGLQIWAGKYTATDTGDLSIQQNVTGSYSDPASAYMAFNVEEARGDFTVVKKSYDVNGRVDAAIDAEVKAAARFVVMEEGKASPNYVLATKQADGLYTYVSSDRYSNTAETNSATSMKLDANGNLKVTNLPLGRTYTVIEYQTGEHYKLDMSDTASRSVSFTLSELNISQSKELGNYEEYTGKINIEKKDNLGNVLSNIEFGIYNASGASIVVENGNTGETVADGALVETIKTNDSGKASTTKKLPKGTYKVKELTVTAPYVVNDTEQTVKLDGSSYNKTVHYEEKTVQVENTIQTATLNIVKTDGATNEPITNNPATFNIKVAEDYIVNGKTILTKGKDIGTFQTDAEGKLKVEGIYVEAQYTITETVPPTNYKKAAPITVSAAWDKTVKHVTKSQSIKNDWQEGVINVYKYVVKNNTNKPLANAKFALVANEDINVMFEGKEFKYNKGVVIQKDVTTDKDGNASFARVPVGFKYIIRETQAPKGYVNAHPEKAITLTANAAVEFVETEPVEVENKEIKLYVSKRVLAESDDKNHINGSELAGAKMAIVDSTGKTVYDWTSDGTEHLIEGIPAGTYTLKELAAPDGYQIATDIEFKIDDQNKVTVTNATVESKDDIPLIVMFDEVTKTEISKKSATTGNELAGAELTLYDWTDKEVESWTSTNKPHVIYGLVVGKTYRLHENLAPIGYSKASDVKFTIKGIDANGKPIVTKCEMIDEVAKGTIKVTKRSENNKNVENIKFILEGTTQTGDKFTTSGFTDANGVVEFLVPTGIYKVTEDGESCPTAYIVAESKDNVTVEYAKVTNIEFYNKLKKGSIKVQKSSENGKNVENIKFILSGKSDAGDDISIEGITDAQGVAEFKDVPIGTYTITEDGETCPTAYMVCDPQSVTVEYAKVTDVSFLNKLKKGSIKVQKSSENGKNIEGIKFILSGKSDAGDDISIEGITDAQGVAEFKDVPIGTYTITEDGETCPTAYMVCDPQSVTVEYAKVTDVSFLNKLKKGSIKVQKSSENGKNIEGIKFILSGKSDAGDDISIEGITDAQGVAEFKDVPIGTYTITEDGESCPTAYMVCDPQSVTVEYAKVTDVSFLNKLKKGSIKIQKKTEGMTDIEGITFTLSGKSDAGDDVNISGKTDANGVVEFKDVPIGTYKITESGVPAGYLVADPQNVTVLYAQTVEATFVNEKKTTPPVPTGYNGNSTMVIILLAAVAALACGTFIVKRKEEK